ncbi:MAG TPA: diacylglycerol kinase family protein [Patescibacteria group bacterium]|nr:diacylglycerol kinase family protein [Patescibacteria group bacterium]
MKNCVIFNPMARGEKATRFRRYLDDISSEMCVKLTRVAGDARRLACEAVLEGFETVVAAGGDGTVNEVLNGLGDAPDGFARSRLGVLPLGTVNVFARELQIPPTIGAAWECIRRARETQIDLPRAESTSNGSAQSRYFAQLAGAGLDARAVELVAWQLKKKIGPLAYVVAGIRALLGAPSQITVKTETHTAIVRLVLIGNGRLYGGSFNIFPAADLRDGLLDVCLFPRLNWLTLGRCAPGLLTRGRLPRSAAQVLQAKTISLTAQSRTPAQIDGELFGTLPATFSIATPRLRVVVP